MERLRFATNSDGISITLAPLGLWLPCKKAVWGTVSISLAAAFFRWDTIVPACMLGLYGLMQIVSYFVSATLQHQLTVQVGSLKICSYFRLSRRRKEKAWKTGQV